jgi:hypothetical protein
MTTIVYITSSTSDDIFDSHITDVQNILAIVFDYIKKHPGNGVTRTSDQLVLALSNIPYTSGGPRSSETSRVKGKVTGNYLLSPLLLERNPYAKIDQQSMDMLNDLAASVETELQAAEETVDLLLVSVTFVPAALALSISITVIDASFSDRSTILSGGRQATVQKSTLLFDYQKLSDPSNAAAWKRFVTVASWERVSQEVNIVRIRE